MPTPRKKPEDKLKVGAKSKYQGKKTLKQVEKLLMLGSSNAKIAEFLEIDEATLYRWCKANPEFRELLDRGRDLQDSAIAKSLFHKAKGYSHKAIKIIFNAELAKMQIQEALANGMPIPQNAGVVQVPYVERYAPDTNAAIFYLTNKRPEHWKAKTEVKADTNLTGQVQHNIAWEAAPDCEPLTPPDLIPESDDSSSE